MGIFSLLFGSKNDEYSDKYKIKMGKHLDRLTIKYVSERDENGCETILGKEGCIYLSDDLLRVVSTPGKVFEGKLLELLMSELLSGEGVIIEGYDLLSGKYRSIKCYFTTPIKPAFRKD